MNDYKRLLLVAIAAVTWLLAVPALAGNPTVRIIFYTGDVNVRSGGSTSRATLGQMLDIGDEVILTGSATLQLSINGKVIKYAKPMKLRIADAVKRAGSGENAVVANTVRTLAAASGSGRNTRSSVAGATRADDSSHLVAEVTRQVREEAGDRLNTEIADRTGIENPAAVLSSATEFLRGEQMLILEPRSTAVAKGPIRFRWLRNRDAESYVVAVKNHVGDEIFRIETKDTTAIWEGAILIPEAYYTWSLVDPGNALRNASASFHQLGDAADAELKKAEAAIVKELGKGNPALPLVLGSLASSSGCYGTAARCYTEGAMQSPEHFDEFMNRARDEYQFNMLVPEEEARVIYNR